MTQIYRRHVHETYEPIGDKRRTTPDKCHHAMITTGYIKVEPRNCFERQSWAEVRYCIGCGMMNPPEPYDGY